MVGRPRTSKQRRPTPRRFRVTSQIAAVGAAHRVLTSNKDAKKALDELVQAGLDPDRVERSVASPSITARTSWSG